MKPSRVLWFSGGKDSLACLYLLQHEWDDITVLWANTGAAHESTIARMEEIRAMVPHFHEARSDQAAFVREWGYPVDVVPVSRTPLGQHLLGRSDRRFIDWTSCCAQNIWAPLMNATRELGATVVYRGQKRADLMHARISSGYQEDGLTFLFPLEDWTDEDVFEYLGDRLPEHYRRGEKTSRDCVNCTAFLHENKQRIDALPHEQRIEVISVLQDLRSAMRETSDHIDSIIGR